MRLRRRWRRRHWLWLLLLLPFALVLVIARSLKQPSSFPAPTTSLPVISTRGSFDSRGLLTLPDTAPRYRIEGELEAASQTAESAPSGGTSDLVIVVHGFNNTADKARYKFDIAAEGLRGAGYGGLIAGFSWDADRQRDPLAMSGYHAARRVAVGNGPLLASFIADWHRAHPDCRIHLLGYSMGARLVLEALLQLERDPVLVALHLQVDSVHLVGAAVDDDEAELNAVYGQAIQHCCGRFFNYYSREDNKLGAYYWPKEGDRALGETGIEHPVLAPSNYEDVDVAAELHSYSEAGMLREGEEGDNHSGYLGNRAPDGRLLDDGVMDLIAARIAALPQAAP